MLENKVVYQIFPRNYSLEGTFKEIEKNIPKIKELGVDIIYLTPIHPIGIKNRKGTYGSPYSIKDYFAISEDQGSKEDFISLIKSTHKQGLKLIMDMVFNHTSYDNVLISSHPEYYFYRDSHLANKVGDWSDICDLETSRSDTQEYLLSVLKYWVSLGVDGFRFDVASMIDINFFKKARLELGKGIIFIGESISLEFAHYLRSINVSVTDDKDMFPTFDALYNYTWFHPFTNFLKGEESIDCFIEVFNNDSVSNGSIGLRLNSLENHDNDRLASFAKGNVLETATSFLFSLKGMIFIYMGQENGVTHKPELFEKDPLINTYNKEIYTKYHQAILDKKKQKPIKNQSIEKMSDRSIKLITQYIDNSKEEKLFIF